MKKFLLMQALITFALFSIFSQESSESTKIKLSVQDAVRMASENNISLKRQKLSLDLLEKKNSSSWNSISPSASITGSYGSTFGEPTTQTWSISGSVNLNLTPSLITAINGAKLNYQNGLISYDEALRSIEMNVRKTYYNLLYTKESVEIQEKNLDSARRSYNSNRERYNRGQLSELNLLNSQYSYESLKPALESAKINYENNVATFKQILGIPQNQEIELTGSLNEYLNLGEIIVDKQVEDLPAVQSIMRQIEITENNLLATRFSAWGPTVSASYSYGKSGQIGNDVQRTTNSLNVNVRLPLDGYLPWSSGALNIDAQKTTLEDYKLQLENQKTTSLLNIENGINKIKQAQSQLKLLDTNINIAQRKYNATLTAYNHGGTDYLTLQNANDALISARLNKQAQLFTLISNVLDLENTLGVPFGTLGMQVGNQ